MGCGASRNAPIEPAAKSLGALITASGRLKDNYQGPGDQLVSTLQPWTVKSTSVQVQSSDLLLYSSVIYHVPIPLGAKSYTGETMVAYKMLSGKDKSLTKRICQHVEALRKSSHPNIVKLISVYGMPDETDAIEVVTESCVGGDLFATVTEAGGLKAGVAVKVFAQLIQAIGYLHSNGICHRALTPETIWLQEKSDSPESCTLKLVDFLCSRFFTSSETKFSTLCGAKFYVAPQMLVGEYSSACDLWSCGAILYTMIAGFPPFYGETEQEVLEKVATGKYSFNMTNFADPDANVKAVIRGLLNMKEDLRTKPEDVLKQLQL